MQAVTSKGEVVGVIRAAVRTSFDTSSISVRASSRFCRRRFSPAEAFSMTMNVLVTKREHHGHDRDDDHELDERDAVLGVGPMQELREALHETFTVSAAGLLAFSGLRVTFALPVLAPLVAVIFHVP